MAQIRIFSVNQIEIHQTEGTSGSTVVSVIGTAATPGYTNVELQSLEAKLSADGILDMELVGTPPKGSVPQVLTPVTASFVWDKKDPLVGVRVVARSNELTQLVQQPAQGGAATAELTDIGGAALTPSPFTTFALGEEVPTTLAFGEEGPKTFWIGEEGPPTSRFGEGPTTLALGEEGPTTRALGEEGPKPFFGETDPRVDDPTGPVGETFETDLFNHGMRNPFTRR